MSNNSPQIDSTVLSVVLAGTSTTSRTPVFLTADSNGVLQTNATTGGTYNVTPPTYTDGQTTATQSDANGNLKVSLATQLAGEDLVNNVLKTEQRFSSVSYSTAQTATVIKTGAGFIHTITILGGTAGTIALYDNTAASGTSIIPTFTPGGVTTPITLILDVTFTTGLTINTGAATIIHISYR